MKSAYCYNSQDWMRIFGEKGYSPNLIKFWLKGLYRSEDFFNRHLGPEVLVDLSQDFPISLPEISRIQEAQDGTIKLQVRLKDGLEVETVLIPFYKRYTICLSTQVGCAMNCSFCYTGTQGLKRNLDPGEITSQYYLASRLLKEKGLSEVKPSIVFMGQGEPLHNFESIKQAISVFKDPLIFGVGHRQMTLSTVGYLPELHRLKELGNINIALSLHSPFDNERNQLIPINARFPLKRVLEELENHPLLPRQFITYEYLLIKDFNMTLNHADELAQIFGQKKAIINLIPFNPFPGAKWKRPDEAEIESFKEELVKRKLRVMIRKTKGDDILAACGQLKIAKLGRDHAQ